MPTVLLAVPVMRGQLEPECLHSLLAARSYFDERGIGHKVLTNECSLISASRNDMAMSFLNVTNADFLMWLDSDISFPPYGIYRLMKHDLDVVGGVYFRKEREARPLIMKLDEKNMFHTRWDIPRTGLFEVDAMGAGFLLVKRRVLEQFTPEVVLNIGTPFGIGLDANGKEEGEDLSFCRRVRKLGFKVWADPSIPLSHIGKWSYGRSDYEAAAMLVKMREEHELYTNEIGGWMTVPELNWLFETAKRMESIVEVGSWKGRSTHALLSGCKGKVTAVDTWLGSPNEVRSPTVEVPDHDVYDEFIVNVGEFPNLEVKRMTSLEAAALFPDKSVDMVFIDGNHGYESVKADIEAWLPKAKRILCGHDWHWHSVQEAVTERFGEPDTAETIWVVKVDER